MHVMFNVICWFLTVFTYISTLCVVSLAKVTIYMIYIEPLFLHVNFKPTNHDRAI